MNQNQPAQISQPQLIQLEVTSHCNLQCAACSRQEQLQFMPTAESLSQKLSMFWLNHIAPSPSFTFRLQPFTP